MTTEGAQSLYLLAPFALMLVGTALGPLLAPTWWHSNSNKLLFSCLLGLPVSALYAYRHPGALLAMGEEYVSFIVLLTSLYVISGGIRLRGDLVATPLTNTVFLAAGALLASLVGTTGASTLLIRPLLETNQERRRVRHTVVFFIFLVSNIGGLLTPLGDPPLFLGYLQGVPFTWTFRLWRPWVFLVGVLLLVYLVWDSVAYSREPLAALRRDRARVEPLRLAGRLNVVWLLGVVLAVAFLSAPAREVVLVSLSAVAFLSTPGRIRRANGVTPHPMIEVAVIFLGIFLTMIPALELLRTRAGTLGIREPWQFFWATGLLSSFLDNAPTYLTFLALAQGLGLPDQVVGVSHAVLVAISLGAVLMGANTYIGNAPNFLVRAIAEEAGVRMPSFFGYLAYSGGVLLPLFVGVTVLFIGVR
jgi:Na+/H+ antiporter NhaD/arsenite permease-like protein